MLLRKLFPITLENLQSFFQKYITGKVSQDLLKMLYSLKFDGEWAKGKINSINDFVLIEEDVFIELDEEAKDIWQEFSKIW